jgi:hypothetical protein
MRHKEAPNGSEASPASPSSMKVAGMPSTVSAPNQVAKTMATTIQIGSCRPAA